MLTLTPILYNLNQSILYQLDNQSGNVACITGFMPVAAKKNKLFKDIQDNNFAFIDATACDNLENTKRFLLTYNFFNYKTNVRLLTRQYLTQRESAITSSNIFFGALAAEREIYDLFGIFFSGHSDLRRILTDYAFVGHPLKKDYPLSGYTEIQYSTIKKALVFKPLVLLQDFRQFNFVMPWNDKITRLNNSVGIFAEDIEINKINETHND